MFETWSHVFETNSLSSLLVSLNHGIIAVWNVARCWTYGAFYKLDSCKSFLAKDEAEPKNEAKLVRGFEVLTRNQKLGWELKKLRQAFKALMLVLKHCPCYPNKLQKRSVESCISWKSWILSHKPLRHSKWVGITQPKYKFGKKINLNSHDIQKIGIQVIRWLFTKEKLEMAHKKIMKIIKIKIIKLCTYFRTRIWAARWWLASLVNHFISSYRIIVDVSSNARLVCWKLL